ncbi:MAG: ribonuclease catalytic domain-containing protein [Limnohabitans sp.]
MFVLFDDAGKLIAGRVLSEAQASLQVELDSGKRVKVKSVHVLLPFDQIAPAELMLQATGLSQGIDLDLAWEFAPDQEFGFDDLAQEYFSSAPSLTERVAMLMRLQDAPHYFRRAGKGRYRKASAETVQQALAAIEKKRQVQARIETWADQLMGGQCPSEVREQLYRILFAPDKNSPEYRAVVQASRNSQLAPLELLQQAGALSSPWEFHWQRFLFEHFPKGTGFPSNVQAPLIAQELPLAQVQAFSIDDSHTTEIDDALSVQGLGSGTVVVGIHIAAPALAIAPGTALDQMGRQRLSTVYMPGYKITMLPDAVVQRYTLCEGQDCPAVSLYVSFDELTLDIRGSETRLERVPIAANLRHDQLDTVITREWLEHDGAAEAPVPVPRRSLAFLWRLAQSLKARREAVRGKPETFNRPDFTFRLQRPDADCPPQGDEPVIITQRQRGSPLDLMVAEAMIRANSTWGQWLGKLGVPAIYRSQASLAPGVKVRMGTKALPHAGIGVPCYAWSTSPLRRYTDLVNQWQIIACVRHGATAALAAPFKPKDAELFSVISAFDAAYTAYNSMQASMERYWTLQYLNQQGITQLDATLLREMPGGHWLARADTLPLTLSVLGGSFMQRGQRVRLRLGTHNLMTLELSATVAGQLETSPEADPAVHDEDSLEDAGPVRIAVDLTEEDAPAP